MTIETARVFFGWCTLINIGLLIWWFVFILLAHDLTYRFHSKCFKMSVEQFNLIHYAGIAVFKVGIFLFNLVPYIALSIMS